MRIKNWEKWQTYRKDRGTPPWVKVYRNLFTNIEWVSLSDAEKGQLVSIWILAADKGGIVPDNPAVIQRMAMLDAKPNINKFIELGFLVTTCQPTGNHAVTTPRSIDAPETETETETDKNKSIGRNKFDLCGFDRFWKQYPKKVSKKEALKAWNKIKPDADLLIADTINKATNDDGWLRGYIPNPTTYLNQERWNDELQRPKPCEQSLPEQYAARQQRTAAIFQKLNGGDVGNDVPALLSPVDEDQW